jgi:hypothetical protein
MGMSTKRKRYIPGEWQRRPDEAESGGKWCNADDVRSEAEVASKKEPNANPRKRERELRMPDWMVA